MASSPWGNRKANKGGRVRMVSVIIPIYNTEPYLEQCIESVVNQSYRDLEIILINDGSTDGSGDI